MKVVSEKKDIHVLNPEQITEPVNNSLIRGNKVFKMPQPALTAALATTPDTGDAPTDTLISNMRTRIAELEEVLKKAQWLKTN